MKKFILSVFLPLLFFLYAFPVLSASASSADEYACVLTETAYFYPTRSDERGLFLLPKSYFVKILSVESDFCKIEYLYDGEHAKKLTGYAKTSELTFVDFIPKQPYLHRVFEVCYTLGDTPIEGDAFLDKITLTCTYYGDYRIGSETYCYILRDGSFGYIPKPSDFFYEENTEYQDYLATLPPEEEPPPVEDDSTATPAQIAILVVLCLLVPVLAALVLKPPKRPTYDENE